MDTNKMSSAYVSEMFEEIKTLAKQIKNKLMETPSAPTHEPIDVTVITDLTGEFRNLTEEVRKPTKHEHRHIIEIGSSKVFLSMVVGYNDIGFVVCYWQPTRNHQTISE